MERVRALLGSLRHRLNPTLVQSLSGRDEALFAEALAQPRAHRASFLAQACSGDTGLLGRLLALLAVHDRPEGARPAGGGVAVALAEEQPGAIITGSSSSKKSEKAAAAPHGWPSRPNP